MTSWLDHRFDAGFRDVIARVLCDYSRSLVLLLTRIDVSNKETLSALHLEDNKDDIIKVLNRLNSGASLGMPHSAESALGRYDRAFWCVVSMLRRPRLSRHPLLCRGFRLSCPRGVLILDGRYFRKLVSVLVPVQLRRWIRLRLRDARARRFLVLPIDRRLSG